MQVINEVKRIKDDLGGTIDGEDNLARMILIEQAIDAANEIKDVVSRSYAFCDCIISIVEFARESSNEQALEQVDSLFEEITNKGAYVRAQAFYALALASFERESEAEEIILDAIRNTVLIKDDFDRRDAILDLATSAGDISFITNNTDLIETAIALSQKLTKGQKAYLYGYLSVILEGEEGISLMRDAVDIANEIKDPITRSKVFLELSNLFTSFNKKFEM